MPIIASFSETFTATKQENIDPLDLSGFRELWLEVALTAGAAAAAGDKLDVYLQSRGQAGIWSDRIHLKTFLGTDLVNTVHEAILRSDEELTSGDETDDPSGGVGGSRLAAGTIRRGTFPGRFRHSGVGTETGWRFDFQVTTVSGPSFPVLVTLQAQVPVPGL